MLTAFTNLPLFYLGEGSLGFRKIQTFIFHQNT